MSGGRVHTLRPGRSDAEVDRRRAVLVTCISNGIEWYDFAVYGAMASLLASLLVPGDWPANGLVTVFAVFATSFLARPVGAVLVGLRADRVGRRSAFAAMVLVMSVSTACIGLLPTGSASGPAVLVVLVLLRLVQGFASGGGISTSIPFLLEAVPRRQWGWYGGWHTASVALGIGAGIGAASVVTSVLSPAQLETWGWRLPFLAALPLGALGVYARLRLDEGDSFRAGPGAPVAATLTQLWAAHRRVITSGFVLVGVLAGTFNMWFVFLPAHLVAIGAHDLSVALASSGWGLVTVAVSAPLFGRLSDRIGRRPLLTGGNAVLVLLVLPLYITAAAGSGVALLGANVAVGAAVGMLVINVHLSERLPGHARATGIALTYGLATAVVGGTAPLVGSVLAERGWELGIPVYLVILAAAGLVVSLRPALVVRPGGRGEVSSDAGPG